MLLFLFSGFFCRGGGWGDEWWGGGWGGGGVGSRQETHVIELKASYFEWNSGSITGILLVYPVIPELLGHTVTTALF